MYKHIMVLFISVIFSFGCQTLPISTDTFFQGTKNINLLDNKGKRVPIGSVSFITKDKNIYYQIHLGKIYFKTIFYL